MKKRTDRSSTSESFKFESVTITIHELDTLVLLLSSKEETVIIDSLQNLDKYCSKDCTALVKIFNLNVLD